jgi:hypothetical protein
MSDNQGGSIPFPNVTHVVYPTNNTTSGSVVFQTPFNEEIHNSFATFTGPKLAELPKSLIEKIQNMNIDFLDWEIKEHKKQVLQQKIFGFIIFGIVILLTLTGIAFSAYQLFNAINLKNLDSLITEFGIDSVKQFYFRSSVVGSTILIISIVFFFLFLQFQYKNKSSSQEIHREIHKAKSLKDNPN